MTKAVEIHIAVVIPCYRVQETILGVIAGIGDEVSRIYCIDDACPERSGDHVTANCRDPRVIVLRHSENRGVGGAVITGYRRALADGMDIVVKIDGDGQMDPSQLPSIVAPLLLGEADYVKGNRFYAPEGLKGMPPLRLVGNASLSFMTKLSTGYWMIFDPTNGYTAIHGSILTRLPLDKIAERYFFESDLLFRLNIVDAVVVDLPMPARYDNEPSSLRVHKVIGPFLAGHLRNLAKRIVYKYFIRDFHLASLELVLGLASVTFGMAFGAVHWIENLEKGIETPAGTVMVSALPIIVGVQMLFAFLNYDIQSVPRRPIHRDYVPRIAGTHHRSS